MRATIVIRARQARRLATGTITALAVGIVLVHCLAWPLSYWWSFGGSIAGVNDGRHLVTRTIGAARGRVHFTWRSMPALVDIPRDTREVVLTGSRVDDGTVVPWTYAGASDPEVVRVLGMEYRPHVQLIGGSTPESSVVVRVPYSWGAVVVGAPAVLWLHRVWRKRAGARRQRLAARRGSCVDCGYDLSAHPSRGKCPECGRSFDRAGARPRSADLGAAPATAWAIVCAWAVQVVVVGCAFVFVGLMAVLWCSYSHPTRATVVREFGRRVETTAEAGRFAVRMTRPESPPPAVAARTAARWRTIIRLAPAPAHSAAWRDEGRPMPRRLRSPDGFVNDGTGQLSGGDAQFETSWNVSLWYSCAWAGVFPVLRLVQAAMNRRKSPTPLA